MGDAERYDSRRYIPWADVEPTYWAAKAALGSAKDVDLAAALGLGSGTLSSYRSRGVAPKMFVQALRGILSEANGTTPPVGVLLTRRDAEELLALLIAASRSAEGREGVAVDRLKALVLDWITQDVCV